MCISESLERMMCHPVLVRDVILERHFCSVRLLCEQGRRTSKLLVMLWSEKCGNSGSLNEGAGLLLLIPDIRGLLEIFHTITTSDDSSFTGHMMPPKSLLFHLQCVVDTVQLQYFQHAVHCSWTLQHSCTVVN